MNEYFNKIEELISKRETTRYVRKYVENEETLITYWHVGKMLSEVGTKYGEGTIKKWSLTFTKKYGKGYSNRNLRLMRQFYIKYKNGLQCRPNYNISWSIIKELLPYSQNKYNYYYKLCIQNNISVRKIRNLIKSNTYESLPFNERNTIIEIYNQTNTKIPIKNPIMVNIPEKSFSEKVLLKYFEIHIKEFLNNLGSNYAYIGSEYEIYDESKKYRIDMLLNNYRESCLVVVELKVRKLQNKDI